MKLGRLAALLREQALLQLQIAEEIDGLKGLAEAENSDAEEAAEPLPPPPTPIKRERRPPAIVRPAGEARFASSQAFADRVLKSRGMR